MNKRTCSYEGCQRNWYCKEWCKAHYKQMHSRGWCGPIRPVDPAERVWGYVAKGEGCWEWTGHRSEKGYGKTRFQGKEQQAHRVTWHLTNGPISEGMQIDHVCRNRACVRPSHLRMVTNKQNGEHRGASKNNRSSGVRGVHKHGDKWQVVVVHNREHHRFGTYATIEEAEKVAIRERLRLYTHNEDDKRTAKRAA